MTLSSPEDGAAGGTVELGELFSAPFPVPAAEATKLSGSLRGAASLPGFGALGGLGSAVGLGGLPGALGKKLEKNGVVEVPKRVGKAKAKSRNGGGKEPDEDEKTSWLWGKEWGWSEDEEAVEGEVLVMRDSASRPLLPFRNTAHCLPHRRCPPPYCLGQTSPCTLRLATTDSHLPLCGR